MSRTAAALVVFASILLTACASVPDGSVRFPLLSDRIERRQQALARHMAWKRDLFEYYSVICAPYFEKYKDSDMPAPYYLTCLMHMENLPDYEWREEVRANSQLGLLK